MDSEKRKKLLSAGINLEKGVSRFLDDEELYLSFLIKFTEDDSFEKMKKAFDCNDVKETFEAAHTLKGVSANMSIDSINEVLNPTVEILRAGSMDGVGAKLEELQKRYDNVINVIKECC